MDSIQIAVKNIDYGFAHNSDYDIAHSYAIDTVRELYKDEQDFQKEEFETMLADGDISDYEEYREEVGISDNDVDYRKSFEENISHPKITSQIEETTNKYMRNINDLPKDVVVTIEKGQIDDKGKPDEDAVRDALKAKFKVQGISIRGFEKAAEAEKKDIVAQQVYEAVGDMINSSDFRNFLAVRASLEKYSVNNTSMIYAQMLKKHTDDPTRPAVPTAVMGYNAFQNIDRQVAKGETAIAIYMPTKRELKTEKQVDKYIEDHKSEFSDPVSAKDKIMKAIEEKGKYEIISGYRLGSVFDISQTQPKDPDNDNYDKLVNLEKPLSKEMQNFADVAASMKEAATLSTLQISANLPEQESLYSAVRNYADTVLSTVPEKVQGIKSNQPMKGDVHTVETAISTYLVCKHIGIECEEKVNMELAKALKDHLSETSVKVGRRETFNKGFDRACRLSDQFNKAFDKSYGIELEAQKDIAKDTDKNKKQSKDDLSKD